MDEYPLNRSEPDTSVNAGRPGRSYFPQGRLGAATSTVASNGNNTVQLRAACGSGSTATLGRFRE
jgi:hypothetical protein